MEARAFLTSSGCGHTSRVSWQAQQLLPWLTATAALTSLQWLLCAFPCRICTLLSPVILFALSLRLYQGFNLACPSFSHHRWMQSYLSLMPLHISSTLYPRA
jgi:hypothetical protein